MKNRDLRTKMRNGMVIVTATVLAATMLTACTKETTSSTTTNVTTTTDEGTTEYSYESENVNGEVTTEESVTTTAADSENSTDSAEGGELSQELYDAAIWIDGVLGSEWDEDGVYSHTVTADPDKIYVHVWDEQVAAKDDLNEDAFCNKVIPAWIDTVGKWREELDSRGLNDVDICFEYVANNNEDVFCEIEGGELTYSVFDN